MVTVTTSDTNSECNVAASKSNRGIKARPSRVYSSLSDHQNHEQHDRELTRDYARSLLSIYSPINETLKNAI